ncbi:oligosaccharide flippase family protein [Thermodesulfobacteriota bacterium]
MTIRSKILKGSFILSFGQVASYGCSFARNIILLRILLKADYGLASAFASAISLLELAAKMALNTLIVQAKEGDDADFQATVQSFSVLAGIASAGLMVLFARPLAQWFNAPQAWLAFASLALIPLLKGFNHLDIPRMQRDMRFGPLVTIDLVPQIIITLAAWPVAVWLKDYRAVLLLLYAKWALTLAGSHLLAERRYRWGWHIDYVRQILKFGWPLLINGFLLFAASQADRFVIGRYYTLEELAEYGMAATLSLVPGFMIIHIIGAIMMPLLSRVQDSAKDFRKRYMLCMQTMSLLATLFATSLIVFGEALAHLVGGEKYAGAGVYIGWLATAAALRTIRAATTTAALAKGDSKNLMSANIFRVSGLSFAIIAAFLGFDLYMIAVSAVMGEVLALTASVTLLSRRHGLALGDSFQPTGLSVAFIALAGGLVAFDIEIVGWSTVLPLALGLLLIPVIGMLLLFGEFRAQVLSLFAPIRTLAYSSFSQTLRGEQGEQKE